MELHADVLVAGGGPAASTAATLLAKNGHSVIMLERAQHPRHQIGESLLPSTIHGVCRMLDVLDEVEAAGFTVKRGGTFRWGRRAQEWTFAFKSTTLADADYAFQVERAKFDQILFENARRHGVDARENVEVLEILSDGERATGVVARDEHGRHLTVRASYVVDASGHGSRLARHVGTKVYSDFFKNVAVYGYFRGAGRRPAPYEGNIVTSAFERGWCWFIPLSDELTSVGAVVDRGRAARIGTDREAALTEFVDACPLIGELLQGAERVTEGMYGEVRIRKDWSYMTDRLAAPGIVLAGDAACFVDPVFSSGVHLATYGGVLAARTIATALSGGVDEEVCLRELEQRYRREFRVWYDFLVAFFDMQQDWDDYFWTARRLLNTTETANEAFIDLIAGAGTAPDEFFAQRRGLGEEFAAMVPALADTDEGPQSASANGSPSTRLNDERVRESRELIGGAADVPLFGDGLVASADGLRWAYPALTQAPR
jgi:halogenation protein CepH